ncbi:MAG TPA: hypothetical protein V6C95_15965, partial [Coleofasciculaceae cyanobacterium]
VILVNLIFKVSPLIATLLLSFNCPGYGQNISSINHTLVASFTPPEIPQTSNPQKAEAERLFQQGIELFFDYED